MVKTRTWEKLITARDSYKAIVMKHVQVAEAILEQEEPLTDVTKRELERLQMLIQNKREALKEKNYEVEELTHLTNL